MIHTRQHFIISIKMHSGLTMEINHYGNHDKRFLIGLYGLDQHDVESYTIRIAETPLIYSRSRVITI